MCFLANCAGWYPQHYRGGYTDCSGTSADCLLMGIFVSYFHSRNPSFGGSAIEGARSFLQDIGLSMFVAVLGANVGPKVISALGGDTVFWLALNGILAAKVPVIVAYFVAGKLFKLNFVINPPCRDHGSRPVQWIYCDGDFLRITPPRAIWIRAGELTTKVHVPLDCASMRWHQRSTRHIR